MQSQKTLISELLRLRKSQIKINEGIEQKSFLVPIHLALGHESIAVTVAATMSSRDKLLLNHRNIHYHLALGATYEQLFAEYSLHKDGIAGGTLGSMNLVAPDNKNIYTSNILGNNLAVALGVAQSARIKEDNSVIWAITGDGAMEEGVMYETLICASSWKLPLVIIIENNEWSLGTKISERRVEIDVKQLAASIGVAYFHLSGNKLEEYLKELKKARDLAASGKSVVVEVVIETLGGYVVEESSGSRYINYHAGKAKLEHQDLMIMQDSSDPLYANQELFVKDVVDE